MENSTRASLMERMRGVASSSSSSSASASAAAAAFPLPTDFFARVAAPPEQSRRWEQQAEQLRADAVRAAKWHMSNEDGSSGWKLSSSKKHFRDTGMRSYCKRQDGASAARLLEFRCMGKVAMPLARAMDALYADNTLDFRRNTTFLVENCLDAAVLHVVSRRDEIEPHHFVGLAWIATRSPGLFAKNRDVCFLRSTGTMLDKDKKEVGYLVMHSVDAKECPSLEASHGLVRTKVSGVFLFKESADARHTEVLWQGSSPGAGAASTSKLMALVHETFTSFVTNLNRFPEAKFLAQQMEARCSHAPTKGGRKHCYMCHKRFTLIRPRYPCGMCGEDVCKDCGSASRVRSLESSDRFASLSLHHHHHRSSSSSSRSDLGATHFCKRCTHSARKELENQRDGASFFSATHNLFLDAEPSEATEDESFERLSALSSNDSVKSLQKILSERSMTALSLEQRASRSSAAPPPPMYPSDFSTSQVPLSPLSIRTQRERVGRSRLETDPTESYDAYAFEDGGCDDDDVVEVVESLDGAEAAADRGSNNWSSNNSGRHSSSSAPPTTRHSHSGAFGDSRRSSYENRDRDLAARLREISAKAQETLDATRRNSCMMSDTSSAPRTSELLAFQQLDQSIAEQADLLNVIGFVRTGRVYMESGEAGGVRISESSDLSDSERFEVLA